VLLTLVIAAPLVRAPSERIFGAEIVGRHHDPFTVMQQFSRPMSLGVYSQPVTDLTGAAIAKVTGAVAAYNWLVLLSFPLSAAAGYLLARHLALTPGAALFSALLFAFSPFHIAQAAYHPHVAQIQWLPLFLLALWRCMDAATWRAVVVLAAAAAAVFLSNFYGGLIAAVMTPVAVAAYWIARARFAPGAARHLGVTVAALGAIALVGLAFIWWSAPGLVRDRAGYAFPREDLFSYAATWWSYVVPPVAHPLLGAFSRRFWTAAHVSDGLLEQQVGLGWGAIGLALIAIVAWFARIDRRNAVVPLLMTVGVWAMICSLSPEGVLLGVTVFRPSALLYAIVPMFRSYARFGVVVQLMTALLAGIGAATLAAAGARPWRNLGAALAFLVIAEYAVWPPALSRDVLPTAAHRWVMQQPTGSRVFDCEPLTNASASVAWLTDGRITSGDSAAGDCAEPQLAAKLWAAGFTHVLVRNSWEREWLRDHGVAEGLRVEARFPGADVLAIQPPDLIYTREVTGFSRREHRAGRTWRWMGADGWWTIVAPTQRAHVMLDLDMRAFHTTRTLAVRLDTEREQTLAIDPDERTYRIGPLALSAGPHRLAFHAAAGATVADEVIGNGDRRALSIAIGSWKWSAE
jgi:hypothetical protein